MSEALSPSIDTIDPAGATFDAPPAPPQPGHTDPSPRSRLNELARELTRRHNRRMLVEYLRLRRSLRS